MPQLVCRYHETILKESYHPADEYHSEYSQFREHALEIEFQLTVPGKKHEYIRDNK